MDVGAIIEAFGGGIHAAVIAFLIAALIALDRQKAALSKRIDELADARIADNKEYTEQLIENIRLLSQSIGTMEKSITAIEKTADIYKSSAERNRV